MQKRRRRESHIVDSKRTEGISHKFANLGSRRRLWEAKESFPWQELGELVRGL